MCVKSVKASFIIIVLSLLSLTDCAKPRIVGGYEARKNYPFMVSIKIVNIHICAGAIINERTVVTAAHCLTNITSAYLTVHVGENSLNIIKGVLYDVAAIHYHELWNRSTSDYDVGLVRIKDSFVFGNTVQPIKLVGPNESIEAGSIATVLGWGFTDPKIKKMADQLRVAHVPIISQSLCRQMMRITDRMLCAGFLAGGIDACFNDSGGPLVAHNNKLIGIVSWGISCGLPFTPGVYTRVSEVVPWIVDVLLYKYNEIL